MFAQPSSHLRAVLLALFVTFLWASSWVLIKLGLQDIPALTFAGLRYVLASLCLLPVALRTRPSRSALRTLSPLDYARIMLYGLIFIAITQGAQFLGLQYLPAITVSLLLNFTLVVVAFLGIAFLAETPTARQWLGVALYMTGIVFYFYPINLPGTRLLGILITLVCVLTNAISSIMGRSINRRTHLSPLLVTTISMSAGSLVLLVTGITTQGLPSLSLTNWLTIAWLAVVNTALAFPLWNHTLRTLSAVESSIINSTMLVQIAFLAYFFLGETLSPQGIAGMAMVLLGALIVQLRPAKRRGRASQVNSQPQFLIPDP